MPATRVLHGWVSLKQHLVPKPVQINCCNHWSLGRNLCFTLDDRRECHHLVPSERILDELSIPLGLPLALESLHHLDHRVARSSPVREGVRIRKEVTLE